MSDSQLKSSTLLTPPLTAASWWTPLAHGWKTILGGAVLAGLITLGATYLVPETFTARTVILPPQQQQSAAASALASLGTLAGLAGPGLNIKSPADQYVALLGSATVSDRIVDRFDLLKVYDAKYRTVARKILHERVRIQLGKRDGLISIEVDDHSPQRAAAIANQLVEELRRLTNDLALTEAQQRRLFFEALLQQSRDRLAQAQAALQRSGVDIGALRAEPRAAAEGYARLQAEVTAAEVRLQALRRSLADSAPEVQQQQAALSALRGQLSRLEAPSQRAPDADYVTRYREYKYHETLFELFSKQYEAARVDESRDGALVQVVDRAAVPELKSRPKRAATALSSTLVAGMLLALWVIFRHQRKNLRQVRAADPVGLL